MKKILLFFTIIICSSTVWAQSSKLSVEKIMKDPKWIGTSPSNIFWGLNSQEVYFNWNPDNNLGDSLYVYSVISDKIDKAKPSISYNLPSSTGVISPDKTIGAFVKNGDLFIYYNSTKKIKQITQTSEVESDPSFSSDGLALIYRKGLNFYTYQIKEGTIKQLTDFEAGAKKSEKKKNEQETWLENDQLSLFEVLKTRKEKELEAKNNKFKPNLPKKIFLDEKRISAIKVSPNLDFVAYNLAEAPKNSKNTVVPNYVTASGFTENIPARTKVGAPLGTFETFIYDVKLDTVWKVNFKNLPGIQDLPDFLAEKKDTTLKKKDRAVMISEMIWSPLGSKLIGIVRSQDNKDRWIVEIDPKNGKLELIDRQRDEAWIAGPGIGWSMGGATLGWLSEQEIYFQSEESGYSHLYKYKIPTKEKIALTSGKYEVLTIELSKDGKVFYLTTNAVHPGEQHFYHLSVDGGEPVQITKAVGSHQVSVSPDEKLLAIRYSYSNKPWELYIQKNEAGSEAKQVTNSLSEEFKAYNWKDPKVITFKARDGQEIYGRIYEPIKKNKKAVIFVHGAGYLQNAHKWWSNYFREYMFHNLLTDLGYTVFDIDYRASAGYGRDVRTGIYRHMGGKDLTDHVDAAAFLVKNHGIDPNKIGIYGGSYGGFITLMALFTTPDVFKAGAALRPVTDWAAYNHGYTSNILNEPHTDSLAYKRSSPIYFANGLKNHLLICHGVVDVNVHYQDVVRLSQRLIELKKDNWELASYPMEDHGFVEPSSWTDEYKRILKLFEEKLK
jgi:dipeptidyl aminopeptidase/acylaminoacyl peptidase